jgi:hypothetical protein
MSTSSRLEATRLKRGQPRLQFTICSHIIRKPSSIIRVHKQVSKLCTGIDVNQVNSNRYARNGNITRGQQEGERYQYREDSLEE